MNKKNKLKRELYNGSSVVGTWSSLSSPNVVSVLGSTKLDFVVIDMEHGSMSLETVENMVRSAEAAEISPIVRTRDGDEQTILNALETGVRSIMVPHIDSVVKADRVAKCCKYYPEGNRGLSPYTRAHGFTHQNIDKSLQNENKETLVGILVEGRKGLSNLDKIASVPGIDIIYLGLFDICQSVGLPGQLNHPNVIDEIKRCYDIIQSHGKISGAMSTNIDYINMLANIGYRFIAYLNDAAAMRFHFDTVLKDIGIKS